MSEFDEIELTPQEQDFAYQLAAAIMEEFDEVKMDVCYEALDICFDSLEYMELEYFAMKKRSEDWKRGLN